MSTWIDELFDMLSWNSDEETQKRGIELARDVKCYSIFLLPHGLQHSKDVWENCAKILYDYPDEILQYCSIEMLEWLGDMNWPGAGIILNRLIKFTTDTSLSHLSICITACVKKALVCDQQNWLGNMSALLENKDLESKLPKEIYDALYVRFNRSKNKQDKAPLIWLAKHNAITAVKWLIDKGADKSIKDAAGKTAYDYAIENGFTDLAELLKP